MFSTVENFVAIVINLIVGWLDSTHYCKFCRTQWHCYIPAEAG